MLARPLMVATGASRVANRRGKETEKMPTSDCERAGSERRLGKQAVEGSEVDRRRYETTVVFAGP